MTDTVAGQTPARRTRLAPATWAWLATALTTILAAVIRLPGLDRLTTLVFDETYYVRDAYSMWHLGYEGTWMTGEDANALFASGDFSGLLREGSFVVHPPLGKWLIGAGMELLGPANPVGWRIVPALAGVACVFLTCRLAWQLFRRPAVVACAGLFVALDGVSIAMSRVGLLDGLLALFILLAFWATVRGVRTLGFPDPALVDGERPTWSGATAAWLVGAGFAAGCACAVKWSGLYVLAGLGLFVAGWELARFLRLRRAGGRWAPGWAWSTVKAFLCLVPTALVTYVASWAGWFAHPQAWGHRGGSALGDLWTYHVQTLTFHEGVTSDHPYASSPISWLVQGEPTLFYWERHGDSIRILDALGNPALWWLAVPALLALMWVTATRRDWACGVVLLGYAVTWVPWLAFPDRTVFTFYTVVLAPFVALCLAWAVSRLIGEGGAAADTDPTDASLALRWAVGVLVVLAVVVAAWYFMPLWTSPLVDESVWGSRTWLPSWR